MVKIKDLVSIIENKFPPQTQENYDNSGLIVGDKEIEINSVLLTIDINEDVVDEAIEKKCNFIIAHHPIIFRPLKRITGSNYIEKTIIKAIKNDIAIYAAHTSVDNSDQGINKYLCDLLELKNQKIIQPKQEMLFKLVTFVPNEHAEKVRTAIFDAGAGYIGNYDYCSYNTEGIGTFRAGEKANPFVGEKNKLHLENEIRIETVFPGFLKGKIINALLNSHPYEEVAYDIYPLNNEYNKFGAGIIGDIENEADEAEFLSIIKNKFNVQSIRFSNLLNKKVKKVAVCSGAGNFLIEDAIAQKADIYISSEFKYNQYIEAQKRIVIVDAGHYETEVFIKNVFYELLTKKFPNFAVEFSQKFQNPVNYL
ncbi:MAG: Nif3-like dinuclear metal center hexameric protein [Bacteroidales bacterium]|nr:Nif3-like dinuclear metal center hexameric protein [Bacteroidales bacterium]